MLRQGHCTTDQVQNRHFHHTLVEIGGLVFDHFNRDHLLGLEVLTFDDLTERPLTQHIQDEISISDPNVSANREQQDRGKIRDEGWTYLWPASSLPKISLTYKM